MRRPRREPEYPDQARQGDLFFIRYPELPPGAIPLPDQQRARILALGEVSGHKHRATDGTVYVVPDPRGRKPRRFLKLDGPAEIVHEEHKPLRLGPGVMEVIQQLEYVPPPPAPAAEALDRLTPMPEPQRRSSLFGDLVSSLGSTRNIDD